MGTADVNDFLRRLSRGMAAESLRHLSDREIVAQCLSPGGEAAFESVVRRHGPMVYRVCWRVLQREHDAEDAFQATFLVLAQKLRTVRKRASLASWLHGVARRVALKAKAASATRGRKEHQAAVPRPGPPEAVTWGELREVLDAELAGLPEKWRLPLVLCCLEGQTQDEAAGQLGWSKRTFRRRLEEARGALGRRLSRRGVVGPAALSAGLLSDCVAPAAVPLGLLGPTVAAARLAAAAQEAARGGVSAKAVALSEGVLKTMFVRKLKVVTAGILVLGSLACSGAVVLTHPTAAGGQDETAAAAQADDGKPLAASSPAASSGPAAAAPAAPSPIAPAEVPLTYVNSKRVRITYESRGASPAGVAAVQLWYTRDGKAWVQGPRVAGGQAPLVFEAPDEGRYGFRVVVEGGASPAGERPQAGEGPQHWVEIDVTPPRVALYQPTPSSDREAGQVTLSWSATDENLAARPVSLFYAERPEGPWHAIAEKLENTGRYVWEIPDPVPPRVYLRVRAEDRAGNVASAETPAPVLLGAARARGLQPQGVIRAVEAVPDKAP
jgi:RNA polymerase sigma factor (sigma-70 family)